MIVQKSEELFYILVFLSSMFVYIRRTMNSKSSTELIRSIHYSSHEKCKFKWSLIHCDMDDAIYWNPKSWLITVIYARQITLIVFVTRLEKSYMYKKSFLTFHIRSINAHNFASPPENYYTDKINNLDVDQCSLTLFPYII